MVSKKINMTFNAYFMDGSKDVFTLISKLISNMPPIKISNMFRKNNFKNIFKMHM